MDFPARARARVTDNENRVRLDSGGNPMQTDGFDWGTFVPGTAGGATNAGRRFAGGRWVMAGGSAMGRSPVFVSAAGVDPIGVSAFCVCGPGLR
jgi:hypothetical protein